MNEDWIEIEGRNKEEALERACNALNTNRTHLKYEIMEERPIMKIRAMKVDETFATASEVGGEKEPTSERTEEPVEEAPLDPDLGKKAKEVLETLIKFIETEATVELKEENDSVFLEIFADNAAVLIGKYGATLAAIQYLVTKMLGLDRRNAQRIMIDSEQYRARRQESLEDLAHRLAERARRNGRPISAEPMNASDRRIIHMALSEDSEVTTKSIGEGMGRKVLIVPNEQRRPRSGGGGGRSGGYGSRSGGGGGGGRPAPKRSGPPRRMHDSFDAPPVPEVDYFDDEEEPDAPVMDNEDGEMRTGGPEDDE